MKKLGIVLIALVSFSTTSWADSFRWTCSIFHSQNNVRTLIKSYEFNFDEAEVEESITLNVDPSDPTNNISLEHGWDILIIGSEDSGTIRAVSSKAISITGKNGITVECKNLDFQKDDIQINRCRIND